MVSFDKNHPDARLIIASPIMYAALEKIRAVHDAATSPERALKEIGEIADAALE